MEKVALRFYTTVQAVQTLKEATVLWREVHDNNAFAIVPHYDKIVLGLQNSCIQRFKYCTDLLWKYFKDYLEYV